MAGSLSRAGRFGDLNQAVVFHEYALSVMHANLHWLPTWLDEGLAEFFAYTQFQSDKIYVGGPSFRIAHLRSDTMIPMAQLITANEGTFSNDPRRDDVFYGESWAAVHCIVFGEGPDGGAKLMRFIHAIERGTPQEIAFTQEFGSLKSFEDKLSKYIGHMLLTVSVVPPEPKLDAKTFAMRTLTAAEAEYELGALDVGIHDRVTGRERLEKAVALDSSLGAPHEELGFLDLDQGRDAEARAEWAKAVEVDPKRFRARFALLMTGAPMAGESKAQLVAAKMTLAEIVEQGPHFAPAYIEMALAEWRLGQMQLAYADAQQAEKLEPWRAGYHLLVANILLRGGQSALAASFARSVAEEWRRPDHNEAVDLWNRVPVADRGEPALALEYPAGATLARGRIVSVSCAAEGRHRTVTVSLKVDGATEGAAPLTLSTATGFESGFSDTLWWGEDHYNPCFHLGGLPAVVAYQQTGAVSGKLLDLEVRDDLPGATAAGPAPSSGAASGVASAKP